MSPSAARRSPPLPALAVLVALSVAALAPHVRIGDAILDDAYITFRYAANLASGRGLVYNAGERVLGTTTPAWAAVLGLASAVAGPDAIPRIARLLAGLLVVASGLIAGRAAWRATGSATAAALVAAPFLVGPHALYGGVSGMESPLFVLLSVLAFAAVVADRWGAAAVAAGLSPLVRPEGVFLVAVVGAAWWAHAGRRGRGPSAWTVAAAVLLPGAALAVGCWLYYGSPLPHSVVAKRAGLYPFTLLDSYRLTRDGISILFPGGPAAAGAIGGIPLFAVLGLGTWRLVRAERRIWPALALTWLLLAFYATSRTLLFPHYFALLEPWALLAWGAALYAVAEAVARLAGGALPRPAPIASLLGLVVALPSRSLYPLASVVVGRVSAADRVYPPEVRRMEVYHELARDLRGALSPGTVALLPEIGVLGFEMPDLDVLDAAGLVSPRAIAHLPVRPEDRGPPGVGAIPPSLVEVERPDLVITLELFARWGLYEQPWFEREYDVVIFRYDPRLAWGALRVHARRGWPGAQALRALPGGVAAP